MPKLLLPLCIFAILFLSGCGNGSSIDSSCQYLPGEPVFDYSQVSPSNSQEFFEYLDTFPEKPSEFPEFWNSTEVNNGWKFTYWTEEFPFEIHRYDSAEEIWKSKLINCHRATILLLEKYPGSYFYIDQDYTTEDHAVFQGKDEGGYFYISFSGLKCKFCREFAEIYGDY